MGMENERPRLVLVIFMAGLFSVVLQRFLESTPEWVLWSVIAIALLLGAYLMQARHEEEELEDEEE